MSLCYVRSYEGLTLETSAKCDKHTISTFVDQTHIQHTRPRRKTVFSKLVFLSLCWPTSPFSKTSYIQRTLAPRRGRGWGGRLQRPSPTPPPPPQFLKNNKELMGKWCFLVPPPPPPTHTHFESLVRSQPPSHFQSNSTVGTGTFVQYYC